MQAGNYQSRKDVFANVKADIKKWTDSNKKFIDKTKAIKDPILPDSAEEAIRNGFKRKRDEDDIEGEFAKVEENDYVSDCDEDESDRSSEKSADTDEDLNQVVSE